jgi:hypothetical protein
MRAMLMRRTAMTSRTNAEIHHRSLSSLPDFRRNAHVARAAYIRDLLESGGSQLPPLPGTRTLSLYGVAFALAAVAFWAVMLTLPPQSAASSSQPASDIQVVETIAAVSSGSPEATGAVSSPIPEAAAANMALDGYEDR